MALRLTVEKTTIPWCRFRGSGLRSIANGPGCVCQQNLNGKKRRGETMAANTHGATTGKTVNGAGITTTKGTRPPVLYGNTPMAAALTGFPNHRAMCGNGAPTGTIRVPITATKRANLRPLQPVFRVFCAAARGSASAATTSALPTATTTIRATASATTVSGAPGLFKFFTFTILPFAFFLFSFLFSFLNKRTQSVRKNFWGFFVILHNK